MRKYRMPTLETERLILRMWSKKDARDLYEYASNPNVGPIAGWKPHGSVAESKYIISSVFLQKMAWAIVDRETNRVIGSIGFIADVFRPGINSRELGYSLAEEYWGRGLMTEAVRCVIKYAFEDLALDVLSITTRPDNPKSRRVIEKCGFSYEGEHRHAYKIYDGSIYDILCYSMLRAEYFSAAEAVGRDAAADVGKSDAGGAESNAEASAGNGTAAEPEKNDGEGRREDV